MSSGSYPVRWAGRLAVVAMPDEIDVSNAGPILDKLQAVLDREPVTLIVDMTATTFCDSAGMNAVVRVHKRASAGGTELRLVMPAPAVRRVFAMTGLDRLIDTYPSLAASLAGRHGERRGAQAGPVTAWPGGTSHGQGTDEPLADHS